MSYNLEHLKETLSQLGVNTLQNFTNKSIIKQLRAAGQTIDPDLIADIIITEQGVECLRNKEIRKEILDLLPEKNLTEFGFGNSGAYRFTWGNNQRSREFLEMLGTSPDLLISSEKAEEQDITEIEMPLWRYQNLVRKKINNFLLYRKKRKSLVHMPTGAGKTRTMLESVCDFMRLQDSSNYVIVWLAHSEELCDQAVESFVKLWTKHGDEDANIVRLWGGRAQNLEEISSPTFVVSSFQTAYSMTSSNNDESFRISNLIRTNCKLLVVDEAHQSIAPTYNQAIRLFANASSKVLGLTATPGRHHIGGDPQETVKLHDFYDNEKIDIVGDNGEALEDPIDFLTEKEILSQIEFFSIEGSNEEDSIHLNDEEVAYIAKYMDIPPSVLKKLGDDEKRTQRIVAQIMDLVSKSDPTIVFASSKESAMVISTLLKLRGVKAESIVGETHSKIRHDAINEFKSGNLQVLVNFGVLTTGFDSPNIRAVVIARPTTSVVLYSQMIGRGLRGPKMRGEPVCKIVNVKDNLVNMPNVSQAFLFFEKL